jgi:hypothetical protein
VIITAQVAEVKTTADSEFRSYPLIRHVTDTFEVDDTLHVCVNVQQDISRSYVQMVKRQFGAIHHQGFTALCELREAESRVCLCRRLSREDELGTPEGTALLLRLRGCGGERTSLRA